ncbi:single-stranded-DNA-specific exonuclease C-terminal domain-containing protein [Ammoniphilus sp. 3BR4]|uniref:single-stranded-DNA-specific exonuclease C-terminal domain-containing protein n=1 Tax=Ammoniphilus sp. 3BR4 TaxID=3158265 RepID=UPI003467C506
MLPSRTNWIIPEIDEQQAESLQKELGISSVLAKLLVSRQLGEPAQAKDFLHPSVAHLHNPLSIRGMEGVVSKILRAIQEQWRISVRCSRSLDAYISASLLMKMIEAGGGLREWIQFTDTEMEDQLLGSIRLVVDSPSDSHVISLHPESLKDGYPFPQLSCSGLAFKVAQALLGESAYALLDLAALGTIASGLPLVGENRVIVKTGLDMLPRSKNLGIKLLIQTARLSARVSSQALAATILRRIPKDKEAVFLLTSDQREELLKACEALSSEWTEDDLLPREISPLSSGVAHIDATSHIGDWTVANIEELQLLAPFGCGNEPPIFLLNQVELDNVRSIGLSQQDLKCTIIKEDQAIEAVGSDGLGSSASFISKNAVADAVGEPVIHEWNGVRKPQFLILDLRISHCQVFDYRGTKDKLQKIRFFSEPDSIVLCFRNESLAELAGLVGAEHPKVIQVEKEEQLQFKGFIPSVFWYDMPNSLEELKRVFRLLPEYGRLYCLFGSEHRNRLASIPSRDQFKWLYGWMKNRQSLRAEAIPALAKSRGISENALQFMFQVFLELGFLKYERALFELVPTPEKKELTMSKAYRSKQNELELETEILYSSFEVLCEVINQGKIIHS